MTQIFIPSVYIPCNADPKLDTRILGAFESEANAIRALFKAISIYYLDEEKDIPGFNRFDSQKHNCILAMDYEIKIDNIWFEYNNANKDETDTNKRLYLFLKGTGRKYLANDDYIFACKIESHKLF